MNLSSDIKKILEIFDSAKGNPVSYREFSKPPLRSPDASFDREAPAGAVRKAPESVFDLPGPAPGRIFLSSRPPQTGIPPLEAGGSGETLSPVEGFPALEAALSGLLPALPIPRAAGVDWPVLLFTGMAGGTGRSTLASVLSVVSARQGRPSLLIDLNETNLFPYLLMDLRHEEQVRVGRTWTLYTYGPTGTPVIVVRPEAGETAVEEDAPGSLSRLRSDIVSQARGLLDPSGTRRPLVLIDAPSMTRQRLYEAALFSSLILSPVKPDLPSLISVKEMEQAFETFEREQSRYCERFYVLNRFEAGHPLHQDIYGLFRQILSRRLCPSVVPEDPTVELALAKGTSLLDGFPECPAALSMAEASRWIASKLER